MSEHAQAVLDAAASLSDEEREQVLEGLLRTLADEYDERAWHAELLRRKSEVEQGHSAPVPWEVVRAEGEKLLHGEG